MLWNSNIRPYALGRYLNDQPIAFCQTVYSNEMMKKMKAEVSRTNYTVNYFIKAEACGKSNTDPNDSIPISIHDPPPNVLPYNIHAHNL